MGREASLAGRRVASSGGGSVCSQYCVFDEADRLFEMGFADQCKEILRQMPDRRASTSNHSPLLSAPPTGGADVGGVGPVPVQMWQG